MKKFKVIATIPMKNTVQLLDMQTKRTYYYKLLPYQSMSQFRFGSVIQVATGKQ